MSKQLESVDVLIIGAGLSGIGSACQLRRNCPDRTFAIFESLIPTTIPGIPASFLAGGIHI